MRLTFWAPFLLAAPAVWAFSAGPPTQRTGAAVDGGLNCTACHRTFAPANSDPRGMVMLEIASYTPGVKQMVKVTVMHPDSARWGFQLTARRATDDRLAAGVFTANQDIRVRCGAAGTEAPCQGEQEFASHNATSSRSAGSNGQGVFMVEWTPPAEDMGDIIFYVAGNAADGTNTNANDVIYTSRMVVRNATGCAVTNTPTAFGLGNAASGRSGLAFNTLFSIYGGNFVPAGRRRNTQGFDISGNRFPTQLDCVTVEVDGKRVPVTYVQDNQINAQAPSVLSGPGKVDVVLNPGTARERRLPVGNFPITDLQPAFFTYNGASVAAYHSDGRTPVADPSIVPGGRPARAGDTISIYLGGLGTTSPVWQAGEITSGQSLLTASPIVEFGGRTLSAAEVPYAGLSPNSISALYQINIVVPSGLSTGPVPIAVRVGSASTQAGTIVPVQ